MDANDFRDGPVWITGAGGLIGNECVRSGRTLFAGRVGDVRPMTRAILDLADFTAVDRRFEADRPSAVIHCAAMSKSPACQRDPGAARLQNVEVTRHLAALAAEIPFIFFSTDLVFDGRKGGYVETDTVNPLSAYAETKAEAERIVATNPRHTVIRTSLNYGTSPSGGSAFNEEMRAAWIGGRTLDLFTDEYRSPIPAIWTARIAWGLLSGGHRGIFHVAGAERLSRFEIGVAVAGRLRLEEPALATPIRPGSLRDYSGAPRSPDTSLNCSGAEKALGRSMPRFTEWMQSRG